MLRNLCCVISPYSCCVCCVISHESCCVISPAVARCCTSQVSRTPTTLRNDWVYTRISNFVQSPILLATRRGICKNWISKVLRDFFHQSESIQSFTCVSVLNDEHLQNYSLSRSTGKSFGCFHLNLWRSFLYIVCLIGAEHENLGYCV